MRLGQERQLCYDVDNNHEAIKKAYIEYEPLLRSKGAESKPVKDSLDIAISVYNQIHLPLEGEKVIGFLMFYGGNIIPLDLFFKANGRKIRFEAKTEISNRLIVTLM